MDSGDTVRAIGYNTPEKGEPGYEEAKEKLKRLILNEKVEIKNAQTIDDWGRLVAAGWTVTASWPIDTERGARMRAKGSAVLASSVHLVCRPRPQNAGVGDWRQVLSELQSRIHEWMPRLSKEGIVGADAIFSCLGPALEIFSRYERVETASGLDYSRVKIAVAARKQPVKAYSGTSNRLRRSRCGEIGSPEG